MKITTFNIAGPKHIELRTFQDERGFFVERFNYKNFGIHGLYQDFLQDNYSRSMPGVLRGLHYQTDPAQSKLVTCCAGKIFDVIVDLRKNSPTWGQSISVELSGSKPSYLWVPAGFAHGFCVLGAEPADVLYKVDTYYNPKTEGCIIWNDLQLKINWPLANPILSEKDKKGVPAKGMYL